MTFEIYFNAEHAFLHSVKHNLVTLSKKNEYDMSLAIASSCVLSCSAALEAIINKMIQEQNKISHWDELRLASKVNTVAELEGKK